MERTDLYLKPEEIKRIWNGTTIDKTEFETLGVVSKASANHAVKKMVEWGNEWCEAHRSIERDYEQGIIRKHQCFECWQELLKLVEGK